MSDESRQAFEAWADSVGLEIDGCQLPSGEWVYEDTEVAFCWDAWQVRDAEIAALKARVEAIQALVNEQAEDEALWTTPIKQVGEHWITNETVQEHLLKQALRGLLHTIKGEQHE